MGNYKKGFTLSETLIVLVVLGLVAAITVPNVFRRYQESLARTKIKKSMTIYDMFVSKSAIDNDFRSENEFNNWTKADGCKNVRRFFDVIEENGCRFVTKDKVHWDFTEPMKPVIALNDDAWDSYLESGKTDGRWSFGFVVTYDPKTGSFRVNDLAYEINRLKEELFLADEDSKDDIQAKIDELEKLYGFMNNVKNADGGGQNPAVCADDDAYCRMMQFDRMKNLCPDGDLFTCAINSDLECNENGFCWNDFISNSSGCTGTTLATCDTFTIQACEEQGCGGNHGEYYCEKGSASIDDCSLGVFYVSDVDTININGIEVNRDHLCDGYGSDIECRYYFSNDGATIYEAQADGSGGFCDESKSGACASLGYDQCNNTSCCQSGSHFDESTYTCVSNE